MATQESGNANGVSRIDIRRFVRNYRKVVLRATVSVGAIVAAIGAAYLFFGQVTRTTATLPFRPVFSGAANGKYPNDLAFGPGDITAASIINPVFVKNKIDDYCPFDVFRGGFFVEQSSMAQVFLDADYEERISDIRISPIERSRLQAEYQAKRDALPLAMSLVFVKPWSCAALPKALTDKVLGDVLASWAEESEVRRGVLNLNVDLLTPEVLDIEVGDTSLLVRADLVRTALRRLADNIKNVERIPGAGLTRLGEKKTTFFEIRGKIDDLVQSGIEPLVISAGRGLGGDSVSWVEQALASAMTEQRILEGRAKSYLDALREYSGVTSAPTSTSTPARPEPRQSQGGSSDVQTLSPQIDRTFIDRIVELSAPNMVFRQELTRQMVQASSAAVDRAGAVSHYATLADAIRKPSPVGLTKEQVAQRLEVIIRQGKVLATQFYQLYEEFSKVGMRTGSAMYQVTGPVKLETQQGFTTWDYFLTVLASLFVTLILSVAGCLVWSHFKSPDETTS